MGAGRRGSTIHQARGGASAETITVSSNSPHVNALTYSLAQITGTALVVGIASSATVKTHLYRAFFPWVPNKCLEICSCLCFHLACRSAWALLLRHTIHMKRALIYSPDHLQVPWDDRHAHRCFPGSMEMLLPCTLTLLENSPSSKI